MSEIRQREGRTGDKSVTTASYDGRVSAPIEPVHPGHETEVVRAFLEQARFLSTWLRDSGDKLESKAATVLGSAGVLLTLMTLSVSPIRDVRGRWSAVLVVLAIGAAVSFFGSAFAAFSALRIRKYEFASREQLRDEWVTYRDAPALREFAVLGMLADQLICGDQETSPIESLADDVTHRGTWVRASILALLVGLGLVGVMATLLLIEVSVR